MALLAGSDAEIDEAELEQRFGAGGFSVVRIDVDGEPSARASVLKELLDGDTELFLLGVRFVPEEYQSFAKETCLEREKQFVRLPGALDARDRSSDLAPGRLATRAHQAKSAPDPDGDPGASGMESPFETSSRVSRLTLRRVCINVRQ